MNTPTAATADTPIFNILFPPSMNLFRQDSHLSYLYPTGNSFLQPSFYKFAFYFRLSFFFCLPLIFFLSNTLLPYGSF